MRIYKTFTDTDGESVDVSQKIYRQLSFSLSDENGKVSFENAPYGDYHVAETKAPDDYVLDSTPIPFSIIEDGMLIVLEKENTPDSGSVEIVKESEDGVIENVGFHIFGTAKNGIEIKETVYTDKEGKFLMDNLLVGAYTVEEIEMPERYIAQEPKTVEVIANEKAVVTFENILKKGSVTTTKKVCHLLSRQKLEMLLS